MSSTVLRIGSRQTIDNPEMLRCCGSAGQPETRSSGRCPWCGRDFSPRTTGGKPQRFCSPRCRRAMDAGLRAWATEELAAGRVTVAGLAKALARASEA